MLLGLSPASTMLLSLSAAFGNATMLLSLSRASRNRDDAAQLVASSTMLVILSAAFGNATMLLSLSPASTMSSTTAARLAASPATCSTATRSPTSPRSWPKSEGKLGSAVLLSLRCPRGFSPGERRAQFQTRHRGTAHQAHTISIAPGKKHTAQQC